MRYISIVVLLFSANSFACVIPRLPADVQEALNKIEGYNIFVGINSYAVNYNYPNAVCFAQEDINVDGKMDYALALVDIPPVLKGVRGVSVGLIYSSKDKYLIKIHKYVAHLYMSKSGEYVTNLSLKTHKDPQIVTTEFVSEKTVSPSIELSAFEAGGGVIYHWKNGALSYIDLSH